MNNKLYLHSQFHDVCTLYIRNDSLDKMISKIKDEIILADNIKSKQTRNGIKESLQKIINYLSLLEKSDNGYVIVASPDTIVVDTSVFVNLNTYWCGNEFYYKPYEEMINSGLHSVGIIIIDSKEATIGYVDNSIKLIANIESGIAGKHDQGGQSQRRFERLRKQKILSYFKEVSDKCNSLLSLPIDHIIISGPGLTKEEFIKADYLDYRLKDKILNTIDSQYTGEEGLRETFKLSIPILEKNAYAIEVKEVDNFFEIMGKDMNKIYYGKDCIEKHLSEISKIIQTSDYPDIYDINKTLVLKFKGEHTEKIKSMGSIVGLKR